MGTMKPTHLPVTYDSQTLSVPLHDASLSSFLSHTLSLFKLPSSTLCLAFETPSGDLAAISTDFALGLVITAQPLSGRLVLAEKKDLLTVDECMRTVLKAVVDTAARREAAAVFLALSGAWERAVRDFGDARLQDVANEPVERNMPVLRRSASWGKSRYDTEDSLKGLHGSLTRALEGYVSEESGQCIADAACEKVKEGDFAKWETQCRAAAECRALGVFSVHKGVSCAICKVGEIRGTRYRMRNERRDVSLCEACRRGLGEGDWGRFTVYDHPWEAEEDYEGGELRAPTPPLGVGDCGLRVMHLQYVLYKVGYLNVPKGVGVFCERTKEAVQRFQKDWGVGGENGVYTAVTRSVLLSLFDELESRRGGVRCGSEVLGTRLRTAMAA